MKKKKREWVACAGRAAGWLTSPVRFFFLLLLVETTTSEREPCYYDANFSSFLEPIIQIYRPRCHR